MQLHIQLNWLHTLVPWSNEKFQTIAESCINQIITVKLKASLQLNALLHIRPFTIIAKDTIHVINKSHMKQLKLENHFILIVGGAMQHISLNCPLITCLAKPKCVILHTCCLRLYFCLDG